jgi:hypothetical protein
MGEPAAMVVNPPLNGDERETADVSQPSEVYGCVDWYLYAPDASAQQSSSTPLSSALAR